MIVISAKSQHTSQNNIIESVYLQYKEGYYVFLPIEKFKYLQVKHIDQSGSCS